MMTPRCEVCDTDLDLNSLCPKGCMDEFDLEPLPLPRTARNRFGGRT